MRCFYHTDREAVGTCRACSKGLCPECTVDLDVALGCKGRHEILARRLALSQARAGRATSILPVFVIVLGAVFIVWGLLSQPLSIFTSILGVGFAALGLLLLRRGAESRG